MTDPPQRTPAAQQASAKCSSAADTPAAASRRRMVTRRRTARRGPARRSGVRRSEPQRHIVPRRTTEGNHHDRTNFPQSPARITEGGGQLAGGRPEHSRDPGHRAGSGARRRGGESLLPGPVRAEPRRCHGAGSSRLLPGPRRPRRGRGANHAGQGRDHGPRPATVLPRPGSGRAAARRRPVRGGACRRGYRAGGPGDRRPGVRARGPGPVPGLVAPRRVPRPGPRLPGARAATAGGRGAGTVRPRAPRSSPPRDSLPRRSGCATGTSRSATSPEPAPARPPT